MKVQKQYSHADYAKLFWDTVKDLDNPNESDLKFMEIIMQIYDDCLPKTKFKTNLTISLIHRLQKSL